MKRAFTTLVLVAALVASTLAFGQTGAGIATAPGQIFATSTNTASAATSQAGTVTNGSNNFVVSVTGGPILCAAGDLQYMNSAQLTLNASTTYLLVWNCYNEQLYVKTAVTGPGSSGTSAGVPTSLLFADWQKGELALNTIVCGTTNCGNTNNGSLTDQRSNSNFPIITDWFEFVPAPAACVNAASGNTTGTNGDTVAGGVAVVQVQTSATGTNTHSYWCHIPLPSKTTSGKGVVNLLDATFFYGVQTAAIGTQAATLASGQLNGVAVFQSTAFPAAGASETQSAAYARADSGTAAWTPAVASFNTGTTTAGQFFSEKFVPGSTLTMNTDLTDLALVVTLQMSATTATITNTPGFIVHYAFIPF